MRTLLATIFSLAVISTASAQPTPAPSPTPSPQRPPQPAADVPAPEAPAPVDPNKLEADRLVDEGNNFANTGDYKAAIERYREAEAIFSRPLHECNIGLAFVRMSLWPQAHYHLTRCNLRWADGTVPGWVRERIAEAEAQLRSGNFAEVNITADPADATIILTPFSTEAIDLPRLWVPVGLEYKLSVSKEGYQPVSKSFLITEKRLLAYHVSLEQVVAEAVAPPTPPVQDAVVVAPMQPPAPKPPIVAWATAGGGAALLTTGIVFFVLAGSAESDANSFANAADVQADCLSGARQGSFCGISDAELKSEFYDPKKSSANTRQTVALVTGGLSLAALGASGYLFYRHYSAKKETDTAVTLAPSKDGASVWLRWDY